MSSGSRLPDVSITEVERKLRQYLELAMVWESGRDLEGFGVCRARAQAKYSIEDFFALVNCEGDAGFALGASLFASMTAPGDRTVCSRVLSRLAYMLYASGRRLQPPQEMEFGHVGRFLAHLHPDHAPIMVAWAEDMDVDDPVRGLRKEPVAVIRGALFSPFVPLAHAVPFWNLASASERFLRRIFWEPCPPDEGVILSPSHARFIGGMFALVSEATCRDFAGAILKRAVTKQIRVQDKETKKWVIRTEPADGRERSNLLRAIAGYAGDRRHEVESLFGLA